MTLVKGLKSIQDTINKHEEKMSKKGDSSDRKEVTWVKLKDKDAFLIHFLQEFDEDAPGYSEKNGQIVFATQHANPKNFKRKAVCTGDIEEGEDENSRPPCYGCEKHREDYKAKWGQKHTLYANVLVDNGTDAPFVAVLSQGISDKSITPVLLEYASEGTVTDKWFKIKRNGSGQYDTSYMLLPGKKSDINVEDYADELFDIKNDVLINIPYEDQAKFYHHGEEPQESGLNEFAKKEEQPTTKTVDDEW